jgi:hypothetical protein
MGGTGRKMAVQGKYVRPYPKNTDLMQKGLVEPPCPAFYWSRWGLAVCLGWS